MARSDAAGALVVGVLPNSPASAGGLVPGDVVVSIDDHDVHDEEEMFLALQAGGARHGALTVVRPDGTVFSPQLAPSALPAAEMGQSLLAAFARDPNATNRFLFAALTPEPAVARDVLAQLTVEFPGFALGHALLAERTLRLPASPHGPDDEERSRAAREQVARAIELDPASHDVLAVAASVLLELGDAAGAERHAARAVELEQGSARAHSLLGQARLVAGRARDALPELHRAVQLNPYESAYYGPLARAYAAAGHAIEADKTLAAVGGLREPLPTTTQPERVAVRPVVLAVLGAALVGAAAIAVSRRRLRRWAYDPEDRVAASEPVELWLVEGLGAAGALSVAVPYLSSAVGFSTGSPLAREIPNHLVPGVVLVGIAVFCAPRLLGNQGPSGGLGWLWPISLVAGLAGLAMTFPHMALVAQAVRGETSPEAALIHSVAGPVVVVLAVLLVKRSSAPSDDEALLSEP